MKKICNHNAGEEKIKCANKELHNLPWQENNDTIIKEYVSSWPYILLACGNLLLGCMAVQYLACLVMQTISHALYYVLIPDMQALKGRNCSRHVLILLMLSLNHWMNYINILTLKPFVFKNKIDLCMYAQAPRERERFSHTSWQISRW